MKICPKCNRHNPGTYNRCPCGEDIRYVTNTEHQTQTKSDKKGKVTFGKIFLSIYAILAVSFLVIMIDGTSEYMDKNNTKYDYSSSYTYTTTKAVISKSDLPEKPCDGMTFAELKVQKWGYKFTYTKCRDFDHLRPNKRYYEVKWYNENFEVIGTGILCFKDENEDNAVLAAFKDYTE